MKFIFLVAALAAIFPLAGWLRRHPHSRSTIWIIMGLLPWIATMGPRPLYIAVISWPEWPSFVKGTEVSIIDILALAIHFSQPRTPAPLPFRLSMAFYFLAVLLSALTAPVPMAALFYPWQLARMFLVYAVVTRACADDCVVPSLLKGMAIGLCIQAGYAIWDRVALGILQAGGGIGDKNLLGMMSHFALFPLFATLLAGQRGKLAFFGPLAGAIVTVLTVSRATIGLNIAGTALLLLLSAWRNWTRRKAIVVFVCVAGLALLAPIAVISLEKRFNVENSVDYDERDAFEAAAKMMLADHPMGIGANNYVVVANMGGYNDRAGVAWSSGSRGTSVHNTFLLAAAETGYLGLIALLIMLARPLVTAFICGWRNRHDARGDLLLGLCTAMLAAYLHAYFEWIFFTFQTQYLFAITVGLTAGVSQQLGYWTSQHNVRDNATNVFRNTNDPLTNFRRKGSTF